MQTIIGIITIGQTPRSDVVPEMARHFGENVEIKERGALDGLSLKEVQQRYKPDKGMFHLATRMRDGTEVIVGKEKILPEIENCVKELGAEGAALIILLCNGEFPQYDSRCLVLEPQRVVDHCIAGLLREKQRLGVIVPVEEQTHWVRDRFQRFNSEITVAVASPYAGQTQLQEACRKFHDASCDLIVLYCMGFTAKMGRKMRVITRKPVIVSSSLTARIAGELLEA